MITEAAQVFCEELTIQSIQSIQKAKTVLLNGNLRKQLEKYHGANTETAFWGWNDVWLHPDFIKWNIERYLPKIRVPILAIQGEDDNYGTQAQIKAIAHQAGAGVETVIISDCSHSPHRDQEAETLRFMNAFIQRFGVNSCLSNLHLKTILKSSGRLILSTITAFNID